MKCNVDDVRSMLSAEAVLNHYSWIFWREGDEFVSTACPSRADHSRDACKINSVTGRWQCFPCGTHGDLFAFVAGVERLTIATDFAQVLARCAAIAGIEPDQDPAIYEIQKVARQQAHRDALQRADLARIERDRAAVPKASAVWQRLETVQSDGEAYLRSRGIDPQHPSIIEIVRYDARLDGSPCTPLFASNGDIRNVVARNLPSRGEPKTKGLADCPTLGTFCNAIDQIDGTRQVVIVEGVFDSLTARILWPDSIVLGAHGAGNLGKIATAALPLIVAGKTSLTIVPHADNAGIKTMLDVGTQAIQAGLRQHNRTLMIINHGHKDLNDAWQAGWRT